MATFEAIGPAFSLDGPLPVAPPHSLLNTEGVVVERDATRVLNGVNVWGYPTGCTELWEPCLDGTFRIKEDESTQTNVRFDSFVVYKAVTCSAMGLRDPQELFDRAEAALDATISAGVESALAAGVDSSSNPFFGDSNVDILNSGTAVSAKVGQSFLEEYLGTECRQGMLHFTPAILTSLQSWPAVRKDQTELLSINGTPIVSGMGYQGTDTAALSTPSAKQDWAFATGPVKVYLGPVRLDSVRENLDREINLLTFRAERYVLAIWDTALQGAVLVDWST
jgi:hypothetical protein